MAFPLLLDFLVYPSPCGKAFFLSFFFTTFFGVTLTLANRPQVEMTLERKEAFLTTSLSWVFLGGFSALPFYFSDLDFPFIECCFEAISALTTTGATVFDTPERLPKSLLLWRSILQWLGGIGIIVTAMTIFPVLKIGGMQLFQSESSDRSEKIFPRVSQMSFSILKIYSFITLLCTLCYLFAGMDTFDSICHSFATVSTGGISTKANSFAFYDDSYIETISTIFMFIGGTTLILYIHLWSGDRKSLFKDPQLKAYTLILFSASLLVFFWRFSKGDLSFTRALSQSFFTCASIMTTCGFTCGDYGQWGAFPTIIVFFLSFIGGCTGSTSGGIKVFRFQIISSIAKSHLLQTKKTHGVYVPLYKKERITESIAFSVFSFIALFLFSFVIISLLLSLMGLDFITSLSGSIACLSNVGPGLGEVIGPHTSFFLIPPGPKIVMMIGMIMGRLELITFLVLMLPSFWRK